MVQDEDGRQQGARKDLATACVRLLASMWLDFPDSIAYDALWQPFFAAVAELKGTLQVSWLLALEQQGTHSHVLTFPTPYLQTDCAGVACVGSHIGGLQILSQIKNRACI